MLPGTISSSENALFALFTVCTLRELFDEIIAFIYSIASILFGVRESEMPSCPKRFFKALELQTINGSL